MAQAMQSSEVFEEVFLTLLMLQEVLKLPLKSVNLANPQSDKVVQMEENSSPLLSFWGVIDQQTTLERSQRNLL